MFARKKKKRARAPRRPAKRSRRTASRPGFRWLGLALAALLVSGLGAYGTVKLLNAWPRFYQEVVLGRGWFDLREVKIDGQCRAVSRQELFKRTGLRWGQNLFTIDLSAVRQQLEMIPYLESVAVEQVLPHLLRIHVVERTPVARARSYHTAGRGGAAGRTWYLDRHGSVMPDRAYRRAPRDPFADLKLPEIIGVNPADLRPGGKVTDAAVYWALRALKLYRQIGMNRIADVKTVDVSERGVLHLLLDNGTEVTLGPDDMQRQLLRLGLLYQVGRRNHKRLLKVDLSVRNNCPSLWQPLPETAADPAARPSTPLSPHDV
jgi:cell division protein FtsQ